MGPPLALLYHASLKQATLAVMNKIVKNSVLKTCVTISSQKKKTYVTIHVRVSDITLIYHLVLMVGKQFFKWTWPLISNCSMQMLALLE